jgi:large subunit ribosomal protein L10
MRFEKQIISKEYLDRLNASPFFLVVDYQGLKVGPITELRKRLTKAGAEMHVVKSSIFRLAVKEAGIADLAGQMAGMLAVVTGQRDVSAAAKAVKTFAAEFERPKVRFGYLGNQRLEPAEIMTLADLPPLEIVRAQFLGLLQAPLAHLLAVLDAPARDLVSVLQAKADKDKK